MYPFSIVLAMRAYFILLFLIPLLGPVHVHQIVGSWYGALDINGARLRLVLHIAAGEQRYTATMDSPDQGAKGIPVDSVLFDKGQVKLKSSVIRAAYEATLEADTVLDGVFSQNGLQFPLRLVRRENDNLQEQRPQEPKPPFPYQSEEVRFKNKDAKVTLAGTLTRPELAGPCPAVILITGSGPHDRNEESFGHRPFLLIADYLTRNGVAVLRYDDRGIGESTGDFNTATSADFAADAAAAFAFLKEQQGIDPTRIGILGHSEGGMLASMVAAAHPDVAFLVLLAAPGIPIDQLMQGQRTAIGRASGTQANQLAENEQLNSRIQQLIVTQTDSAVLVEELRKLISPIVDQAVTAGSTSKEQAAFTIDQQVHQMTSPWMRFFLTFDPTPYLQRVTCPVLAFNGSNDLQVVAKPNLQGIETALKAGGNTKITVKELPGLNHLFQESQTGLPTEYGVIQQTMAPAVLQEIQNWLAASKIMQ